MADVAGRETTDVEDMNLLADAIVELCKTSNFNDMTWAEIDHGMMLASSKIKVLIVQYGTLDLVPV